MAFLGNKKEYISRILFWGGLFALLCVQILLGVYFGNKKVGFFVDEELTYMFANNVGGGYISEEENFLNEWKSGQYYFDALTYTGSEFELMTPLKNNLSDDHPVLYYELIHIASFFGKGIFSKWIGIIPNLIFAAITTIFLYLLIYDITHNLLMSVAGTSLWSICIGAMTSIVYIRMYGLLTMWGVILVFYTYRYAYKKHEVSLTNKYNIKELVAMAIVTGCGLGTQYYFYVFCLIFCGTTFLFLIYEKRFLEACLYCASEFVGIAISVIFAKNLFFQLDNGMHGKNISTYITNGNIFEKIKSGFRIVGADTMINLYVISALFIFAACVIWAKRKKMREDGIIRFLLAMLVIVLIYGTVASISAPWIVDRFFMIIYPYLGIIAVCSFYELFSNHSDLIKFFIGCTFVVITVLTIAFSYKVNAVKYLYTWIGERSNISEYYSYPAVVWNMTPSNHNADAFIYEYMNFDEVLRVDCNADFLEMMEMQKDKLSDGFVLYIVSWDYNESKEETVLAELGYSDGDYKRLCSIENYVYFCGDINDID